jgi:alkylation response protein AidB-like acyl-CoA dehydrogenase
MYHAPLRDLRFVINELIGESAIRSCPSFADYSAETADAILGEAARFAEGVLEPINKSGDRSGAKWTPEGVVAAPGFKEAFSKFVAGGWTTLNASPEFGGQGVPSIISTALEEIWASANLAFKLCPMLTGGAIEALSHCGSPAQKKLFLPKMVSGEWTGTMNLTEPQAGTDLGSIRTRAVPDGNRYRLFGQKIFITYGDHDLTSNIIHMVLARIEGSPPGTKGISLFIVPKVLVNEDGSLGERNEVRCVSIEHKLGIHGSPTCVLAYGDGSGAIGYLVGEQNRGLEYMFIMMNAARLSVGLEGYALAERAFQQAADWAKTRVQGKPPVPNPGGGPLPIIHHPDVKRMLLTMKSTTEAMRALGLYAAHQLDLGSDHPDEAKRAAAAARGDLLIPIVKGWSTENGVELASLGIQIHGGMGFIEETGAAQTLRDVRITTIYEGTTGIQANDLIGRKIGRDHGAAMGLLLSAISADLEAIKSSNAAVAAAKSAAAEGVQILRDATASLLASQQSDPKRGLAIAVPYLKTAGTVLGAWLMARSASIAAAGIAAGSKESEYYNSKLASARFYAEHVAPMALSYARIVKNGIDSVVSTDAALIG